MAAATKFITANQRWSAIVLMALYHGISLASASAPLTADGAATDPAAARPQLEVAMLTHRITPAIEERLVQWKKSLDADGKARLWVAGGARGQPPSRASSWLTGIRVVDIWAQAAEANISINRQASAELPNLNPIAAILVHQASGRRRSSYVWVLENDVVISSSLSGFLRAYDHVSDDFISAFKLCPLAMQQQCVGRFKSSILVLEDTWRGKDCAEWWPHALHGPGAFVMVMRASARLVHHVHGAMRKGQFCFMEKQIESICTEHRLLSRSLSAAQLGYLDVVGPKMRAEEVEAAVTADPCPRIYHPVKSHSLSKQAHALEAVPRSWDEEDEDADAAGRCRRQEVGKISDYRDSPSWQRSWWTGGGARYHCQIPNPFDPRYRVGQFATPRAGDECRPGCWVLDSSNPALLCKYTKRPGLLLRLFGPRGGVDERVQPRWQQQLQQQRGGRHQLNP